MFVFFINAQPTYVQETSLLENATTVFDTVITLERIE